MNRRHIKFPEAEVIAPETETPWPSVVAKPTETELPQPKEGCQQ